MDIISLFRDQFLLACYNETRLLNPQNYHINRLPTESIFLLEDGHCLRHHALSPCHIKNQEVVSRFAASSLLTLIARVDSDIGITYLTEMSQGSSRLQQTNVVTYPLAKSSYREMGIAWRKGSARVEAFRLLGELIKRRSS